MMVTGQEQICSLINSLTIDTFPRTLMLVGPRGGGKHLLCDMIADKFQLMKLDITETLDQETIDQIYERVEPYLYIIRVNEISVKEENTILKFLEEPLKNAFIVLIANTEMGILQTILNRCQIWYLQNYKRAYLETFVGDKSMSVLDVAETPGQVIELCNADFESMIALADKILDKIHVASAPNTLTLSSKVGFKNEENLFPVTLFVDVLLSRVVLKWKTVNDSRYVTAYELTRKLKETVAIKNMDTRALFERYLIQLRTTMRGSLL